MYNAIVRGSGGFPRPDDHTFPFILTACADTSDVEKGLEVHATVLKLGFDSNVFVSNTLILFYGAGGRLDDARNVFDEMPQRDVISWNSIVSLLSNRGCLHEALGRFSDLISDIRVKVNCVSVVSVLPACAMLEDECAVKGIHGFVVKAGLDSEVTVCNAFVDVYGKCGNVGDSKRVFDGIVAKSVVSWNAVIGSFAHVNEIIGALDMFRTMLLTNERPDAITFACLLPALSEFGLFNMGREIHCFCLRTDLKFDVFLDNALIDMYAKCGRRKEADIVFNAMERRTIVSWNSMVANFAQNGFHIEAMKLVREMQDHGECPNSVTFTSVLPACSRLGALREGKEIHARSIRLGPGSDLLVTNALTDMYMKCGEFVVAKKVFETSLRDKVSYNILISGFSQNSHCLLSLEFFREMKLMGIKYDAVSFIGVLSACANLRAIKQGKEVHGFLLRRSAICDLFIYNAMLDLYTKCGRLDLARQVFDEISVKDEATWNTMILGYGMHGELEIAINLFDRMKDEGVPYDHVSYVAVLSVCSHGGLVERGKKYFDQMVSANMKPLKMHYACMVDLLGRAGRMEEAATFIRDLPIEPDCNVWGALLGASRVNGDIKMARWAADHLFDLKPEHSGYYTLLSNMYAELGRWDEAINVRRLMKFKRVRKNPGCSWVELDRKLHAFVVGDTIEMPHSAACLG